MSHIIFLFAKSGHLAQETLAFNVIIFQKCVCVSVGGNYRGLGGHCRVPQLCFLLRTAARSAQGDSSRVQPGRSPWPEPLDRLTADHRGQFPGGEPVCPSCGSCGSVPLEGSHQIPTGACHSLPAWGVHPALQSLVPR